MILSQYGALVGLGRMQCSSHRERIVYRSSRRGGCGMANSPIRAAARADAADRRSAGYASGAEDPVARRVIQAFQKAMQDAGWIEGKISTSIIALLLVISPKPTRRRPILLDFHLTSYTPWVCRRHELFSRRHERFRLFLLRSPIQSDLD